MRAGPHPRALPPLGSKTRSARRPQALLKCARGPTPARGRPSARRLARRGGRRRCLCARGLYLPNRAEERREFMTFNVEVVLKGRDFAVTEAVSVPHGEPATWTEAAVYDVLVEVL